MLRDITKIFAWGRGSAALTQIASSIQFVSLSDKLPINRTIIYILNLESRNPIIYISSPLFWLLRQPLLSYSVPSLRGRTINSDCGKQKQHLYEQSCLENIHTNWNWMKKILEYTQTNIPLAVTNKKKSCKLKQFPMQPFSDGIVKICLPGLVVRPLLFEWCTNRYPADKYLHKKTCLSLG